jgi:glycosyltransferase involved in cell wall biosynthesis
MGLKLALSTLCENPAHRTGLSTLFPEFIVHARRLYPDISWLVFAGEKASWGLADPGIEFCTDFPSNEAPAKRLVADHFHVAPEARRRGASALLTVGFHPLRDAGLPIAMHVFAVHGFRSGGGMRHAYRRRAVARGLKKAALVVANSEWTRSRLGESGAPIIVSPEGIRHDVFKPDGPKGMRGLDGDYLLWVSNLYPYKRFELALGAYALLEPGVRARFPLVVVGGDWNRGLSRARESAERLGVADQVRFMGWVRDEDLPGLYRGARAHVLSSSEETFGRSVLEAMACGCVNLIQDLSVFREVAGGTALYTDFASAAGAASILAQVCAGAAGIDQLRTAGLERAAMFNYDRLTRERVAGVLAHIVQARQ